MRLRISFHYKCSNFQDYLKYFRSNCECVLTSFFTLLRFLVMLNIDQIPKSKKAVLTQRVNIAIDEGMKKDLLELKGQGVDVNEWLRRLIRKELPKVKQFCQSSG